MDNRFLLAGVAVVAVGAAFAGGYYVNRSGPAPVPPSSQTLPTEQVAQAPAAAPVEQQQVTEPAAPVQTAPVAAKPVVKKRRLPDYASGETAYGPPPPPPPPPPRDFGERPNPFEGRFATFPMNHSGTGTLESPLTWTAQTEFGNGHEADLRVSLVVPMPPPGDNGVFWSRWSMRGSDDVMPEITRGTPVVVAGSMSVVVAIDPQFLDLDAPAILSVNGRDGQRIYRSRDVAPARGESWSAQGARWIFQPDADFFRMMRDGANVSVMLRSRVSANPINIPFSTDDFPPSLNGFERDLYGRMPGIAAAWDRARPGAPPPPPPMRANNPPPSYPPQQNYPRQPNGPFGGPGYPQRGPQQYAQQTQPPAPPPAPAAPVAQPAPQGGNGFGHGPGDHMHDHGAPTQTPTPPAEPKPNTPPPAAPSTPAAQPAPQPGNGGGHGPGDHMHDHGAPNTPPAPPAAAKPNPPPAAPPPAKPAPAPVPAAPPPPRAAAANPGAAMIVAEVAAYHPPTDGCGAPPPMPQSPGPSPERKQAKVWFQCRAHWMNDYKQSINALNRDAARQRTAVEGVSGGSAIIAAFEKAQSDFNAQKAVIKP